MRETQNSENKRPGFLIYYETLDALSEYSEAETGAFVRAMAEYARYGVIPDFDDRGLRGLWRVVQPILTRDDASYNERCRKNRYNSYISSVKRRFQKEYPGKESVEGRDFLSYEDWISQIDEATACDGKRPLATGSQLNENQSGTECNQNDNQIECNKKLNREKNVNQKGEPGKPPAASCGELRQTSFELRQKWNAALDAGDMQTAMNLANELFRMGFITDPKTREIKVRD